MRKHYLLLGSLFLAACSSGGSNSAGGQAPAVQYSTLSYPGAVAGSAILTTGIRGVESSDAVYISAVYNDPESGKFGLIYKGPLTAAESGTWSQPLRFPSSAGVTVNGTEFYGPNNADISGNVEVVGNYNTVESGNEAIGFYYHGPLDGSGTWQRLNPQALASEGESVINTIAHSTMGGLIVGNYDTSLATGKAFIYDVANNTYYNLAKPGAVSITAYGIWQNSESSYTIAGGFSNANGQGLSTGYLVEWNALTHTARHWTEYNYNNQPVASIISHFEGITTDGQGGYYLASDTGDYGTAIDSTGAALVHVTRRADGGYGPATWTNIVYPGSKLISANTVFGSNILGVYTLPESSQIYSYLATVTN